MNDDKWMIICITITCLVIFFIFAKWFNAYECATKAVMQELEWSYGSIQGCMVKRTNGKWIDYDHLRYVDK